MESIIGIIVGIGVVCYIVYKKKPEWITIIKNNLKR